MTSGLPCDPERLGAPGVEATYSPRRLDPADQGGAGGPALRGGDTLLGVAALLLGVADLLWDVAALRGNRGIPLARWWGQLARRRVDRLGVIFRRSHLEVTMYPEWLPEPLEPVVARLARVDDCICEMGDLSAQWSLRALELKQLRRGDGRFRSVVSAVRPIPPVVSLLFSEAINHLRAVLDNTVWHLVTEAMGVVDDRASLDVMMPIHAEAPKFDAWAKKVRARVPELGEVTRTTHQRVKSLQPFASGARVASISPTLAALTGVQAEEVHPLLLLKAYSNLDKHRAIALMVGRTMVTEDRVPFFVQDRSFRQLGVGAVLAEGTWGTPALADSQAAVMVERPAPWAAAVSPAKETERLRDWVRQEALPRLVTGSSEVTTALPVTVELGDNGRTLPERIADVSRPSGRERLASINGKRFAAAVTAPPKYPPVVDEEFED